ncbi:MAG: DUF3471 domain-containing protein [Janthinobacterium lividum]
MVLTNQEAGGAIEALTEQLADGYLGLRGTNRVQQWARRAQAHSPAADTAAAAVWQAVARRQALAPPAGPSAYQPYAGTYRDPWFGDVRIDVRHGTLWFQALKSPQLRGPLLPYRGNTFVVRWANPQIQADAFVMFALDARGRARALAMQAVAAAPAAGYDFQDLDLQRVSQ